MALKKGLFVLSVSLNKSNDLSSALFTQLVNLRVAFVQSYRVDS